MGRPAVFLDRDGTLIEDVGYLSSSDQLRWFPYTVDALRLLNRAGFLVIVTTNQGGIGLGLYSQSFLEAFHRQMAETLEQAGAHVDAWFYCPHHPQATIDSLRLTCECRKPAPGMIHQACERFQIDLGRSFVVGDKIGDVGLAVNAGARGVLVRTGSGERVMREHGGDPPGAAYVAAHVMEATSWLLGQSGHPK